MTGSNQGGLQIRLFGAALLNSVAADVLITMLIALITALVAEIGLSACDREVRY